MSDTQHAPSPSPTSGCRTATCCPRSPSPTARAGRLAADGRNAVLVTHGYTSGHRMIESGAGSSEGAWSTLVGPGAPIDTDRCFVVCSNMLGSSYGSTNAASLDPRTGRPYGSRFPHITVADIVTAQHRLLEHLGVRHLRAVVGPVLWRVPGVPVGGDIPRRHGRRSCRWCRRRARRAGTAWRRCSRASSAIPTGMAATTTTRQAWARPAGAARRNAEALRHETPREASRSPALGDSSAGPNEFDANSLLILGRAMEAYDVTPELARIRVPVLYVLSRTDALFPPSLAPGVMDGLRKAGVDADYFEIDSDKGHLASGADAAKWAPALREFMQRLAGPSGRRELRWQAIAM